MHNAYKNEPTEKYTCRFCQKEYGVKGFNSHLWSHDTNFKDYIKKFIVEFPEDFPKYHFCPICKENITSGNCCSIECISKWKEEHYKGRNIWDEMSNETSLQAKKKIAEKTSIRMKGNNLWEKLDEETSKNAKEKISIATGLRVKGEGNPMFGKTHTPEAIQKILTKRPKTSIEEIISKFLDESGIEYYFQFFINKESTHSYDFKIKGIPLIIEADGDYWHGGPSLEKHFFKVDECIETDKLKTEVANERGYDVIRFWESEIHQNFESVKLKILSEIETRRTRCQ